MRPLLLLLAALSAPAVILAEDAGAAPASAAPVAAPAQVKHPLHYASGTVTVGDQLATIELPPDYQYLQADDARFVVEKLWGNPPDASVLGLVVPPKQADNFDWAIVVSFEDTGYVKDDDAKSNDYGEILKQMQEAARDENDARKQHGYPTIDLLGWAESPHYDATTHKVYWAKRIRFGDTKAETLNYDIRVLGRKGVLILSAIASEDQLAQVAANSQSVLAKTGFTDGNRYEDFKPGNGDKVAAYGIAGLIAGGVLLKTGFFSLLLKGLAVAIKPLLFGGAVVVGVIAKLFKRNKAEA